MNLALQKTIAFLFLILLGFLLRKKLPAKEQIGGIKMLILSVALPAMIFVALLNIEIELSLLYLPVLAIAFNFIMAFATNYMLPVFGIEKNSSTNRTLTMLLPSLAPGLSCFPYLLEYLGEEMFAWAALADVGNKIFVLIVLYMLAMSWFYKRQSGTAKVSKNEKLKSLMVSLIEEPVNMVIVTALLLLTFGINLDSLPYFLQNAAGRLSAMMTPLILLFIGLAVKVDKSQIKTILGLLVWRSGLAFVISAALIYALPEATPVAVLILAVAFPQSSASFWPFAHISAISSLEEKNMPEDGHTFDRDLALAVLAFSLPFSTMIILAICSIGGPFFTSELNLLATGFIFLACGALPFIITKLREKSKEEEENEVSVVAE
ncbi:permease [Chondrinema litorale]|uniref:permease n=1 Tax=Chondrinema litorale TaxID=2994555 RepID=UPI002543F74A|nr:permease [Chondrinema litorale]UZR94851.1 permease [Chondrinema litorale]